MTADAVGDWASARPTGDPSQPAPRPVLFSTVLVAAALVAAVVVTLGAPLVTVLQEQFRLSADHAQWSYTVTLLVGAVATPVLGRVTDGRHMRGAAVAIAALVAIGCLLSAVAGSFGVFLAGHCRAWRCASWR
ncbi:hypothetical protein [Pseudonocardia sp. NPDC049154]|uniref:hypothetical protein n=1 Tax=Pseudonocardia sp. NPDC049154 TaxID=3155501 RepID=UPI0033D7EB6A